VDRLPSPSFWYTFGMKKFTKKQYALAAVAAVVGACGVLFPEYVAVVGQLLNAVVAGVTQ
jgi:hypothetical protein